MMWSRRRANRLLAVLAREDGAAAVEFAMVAAPFLALVFGILELGLVFLIQTSLDNATENAARRIRTGELQTAGETATTFKAAVCNAMSWISTSCATDLNLDVRTYSQFASVTPPSPLTNGAVDPAKVTFTPGGPGDIVLVRAFYTWPLITPVMNSGLQNLAGGKRLITSTVTFRNEPYGTP